MNFTPSICTQTTQKCDQNSVCLDYHFGQTNRILHMNAFPLGFAFRQSLGAALGKPHPSLLFYWDEPIIDLLSLILYTCLKNFISNLAQLWSYVIFFTQKTTSLNWQISSIYHCKIYPIFIPPLLLLIN